MFSIIIFYSCSSSSETEKKPKVKKRIMTPGPKKKEGDEEPMVEDVQHLTPGMNIFHENRNFSGIDSKILKLFQI